MHQSSKKDKETDKKRKRPSRYGRHVYDGPYYNDYGGEYWVKKWVREPPPAF